MGRNNMLANFGGGSAANGLAQVRRGRTHAMASLTRTFCAPGTAPSSSMPSSTLDQPRRGGTGTLSP
eukprot:5987262-Pyramimonas_sp.AAC.1